MKRDNFILELGISLVKPLLIRRLTVCSLRISLRLLIEDFVRNEDIPEDQDTRDELPSNVLPKYVRCSLCLTTLDRKIRFKCLRYDKPMCKEHVTKICCEGGDTD